MTPNQSEDIQEKRRARRRKLRKYAAATRIRLALSERLSQKREEEEGGIRRENKKRERRDTRKNQASAYDGSHTPTEGVVAAASANHRRLFVSRVHSAALRRSATRRVAERKICTRRKGTGKVRGRGCQSRASSRATLHYPLLQNKHVLVREISN